MMVETKLHKMITQKTLKQEGPRAVPDVSQQLCCEEI